jgi:hypothetical protein
VTPIPAPLVGSYVQVTGFAPSGRLPDGTPLSRLYPRSAEEVKPMPTPVTEVLRSLALWLTLTCFRGRRVSVSA